MDPFPLLTLPQTALHKLLNQIKIGELFQLSQCSRKASNAVKTYSSSFDETQFDISVTIDPQRMVKMYRCCDEHPEITFTFYGERDPERCYLRFPKTYDFDGRLIDFCKEGAGPWSSFGCATPHSTADIFAFAHYCKTLFNANLYSLDINVDEDNLKTTLMSEWLRKSQFLYIVGGGVTHEEMVQLLKYFDEIKYLDLCCTPGQCFSYDKTISAKELTVSKATWIGRHNLLKLDSEYVNISGCLLENEDLNAFLSHWLRSGDRKLETMRIDRNHYFTLKEKKYAHKFDQEEVLKGLPTIPGAPKRRDAISALRYIERLIPFEAGMDLRRESDGVLATVVVREEGNDGLTFTFVVWPEPNPNVLVVP